MIELSEKVIAIWFIQLDYESDFIAALQQEREDYFTLTFRFRYYVVENHPFSGWDDKRWYKADFHGTKEKALEIAKNGIRAIERETGNKADEITASSAEEYMEALKNKSYAHVREATEEERKNLEKESEWPEDLEVSHT